MSQPPNSDAGSAHRKLVLSIDVGTTFSGMSYAIINKGENPDIKTVTRYPGQEDRAGDYRIPTIIYYRKDGSVHSVGAQAASEDLDMEPDFKDLVLSNWFKLHLRPQHLDSEDMKRQKIPPLPAGKTVIQVFADFLKYMFSCARTYISENHANGEALWLEVQDAVEFVLTHPNGWEGLQQSKMRDAAILAGLIPDTDAGRARVRFVSEGEASLHFCVQSGLIADSIKAGEKVMVVDAGGGTVDVSTYFFKKAEPLVVEELAAPDCVMQGSAMVNVRAEVFFKERLKKSSKYSRDESVKSLMKEFEKQVKPLFKPDTKKVFVDTRQGGTTLLEEMTALFKPSLDGIVNSIRKQFQGTPETTVFLVGGFSANAWLYASLKEALDKMGLRLYRPDAHMSKAVASGAVSFYFDQFVSSRVVKATYGTSVAVPLDPEDREHLARLQAQKFKLSPLGLMSDAGFSAIVKKARHPGARRGGVCADVRAFVRVARGRDEVSKEIMVYTGEEKNPVWTDLEPKKFKRLCVVHGDITKVLPEVETGFVGIPVFLKRISIILRYGPEIEAQVAWEEDGEEKRGPAQIVYDDVSSSSK
ncbi:hypothetical protein C8Q80DRAFT_1275832 [Daedaleopsis nitida]|nr:hypothetical protein C8Q80DRAFT_1275832 [Daedaleopsis nitida]